MRIAILGATSEIAKDLILSFSDKSSNDLVLFSRDRSLIEAWCRKVGIKESYQCLEYPSLSTDNAFDAVINFVGSGDPAKTLAMGSNIFDINQKYDDLVLDYLKENPYCRYLYMSSGSAYGSSFESPANQQTKSLIDINNFQSQDFYSFSKIYSECRHRLLKDYMIVDIRIFNYFSSTQDLNSNFLIADIIRTILSDKLLTVSSDNISRDFLHPDDFYQLVNVILLSPPVNDVVDAYTLSPVNKIELLDSMRVNFGLNYAVSQSTTNVNSARFKLNYYSLNKRAADFGYSPFFSSMSGVLQQTKKILEVQKLLSESRK
jgi:nucleoside-diphosphate-sugar epimerase